MSEPLRKFAWVTQVFSALSRSEITPGQEIGCTRCDFTGPPAAYAEHAMNCPTYME